MKDLLHQQYPRQEMAVVPMKGSVIAEAVKFSRKPDGMVILELAVWGFRAVSGIVQGLRGLRDLGLQGLESLEMEALGVHGSSGSGGAGV